MPDAGSEQPPASGNASSEPSTPRESTSAPSSSGTRRQKPRPVKWEWNLPLLGVTAAVLLILPLILYFTYSLQTSRIVRGIWERADAAKSDGDFAAESRWLNLLVTFDKNDKEALIRLALAVNQNAKSGGEILAAERALVTALGAVGETTNTDEIQTLRRLLIQRLLDLGSAHAGEVERQVTLLKAEPENPDALRWLALSLFSQVESGEWRTRFKGRYDRNKDFWNWVSFQPVGEVLRLALDKNPDSPDLAISLLHAYVTRANFFDTIDNDENRAILSDKAKALITQLKAKDDGKIQWACYFYAQKMDRELARSLLPEIAPMAAERLRIRAASAKSETAKSDSKGASKKDSLANEDDWDVKLLTSYATQLSDQGDNEKAYREFQELIALEEGLMPKALLESIYVGASNALWNQGNSKDAHRILREGCERIGPLDGLALWHTIAYYSAESGSLEEAKNAMDELDKAIKDASVSLFSLSAVRVDARLAKQVRLDAVKWYADVLRAGLEIREGRFNKAVQNLSSALATRLSISPEHRSYALKLLAHAQAEMGVWDLSARALEEAITINPDDKLLRRQAAEAWARAGGSTQAIEQLKLSDDGSFDMALTMLQSALTSQRTTVPSQRDNTKIRLAIEETEKRLAKEKQRGAFPPREWFFEAIKLSSENGMSETSASLSAVERDQKFLELVKRHPTIPELQSLAAVSLRMAGKSDESKMALANLEDKKSSHLALWLETQIKLAFIDKDLEKAKKVVDDALASGDLPKPAILNLAANLFESTGQMTEALGYLKAIGTARTESEMFRIGSILLELEHPRSTSSTNKSTESTAGTSQELDEVIRGLMEFEGDSGTRWRILKASRLYKNYLANKNEKDLRESAKITSDILASRPRWVTALTLGGEIASAQGNREKAVGLFQRAIAEGDQRVSTVFELVRQLNGLGKFTEAEIEFERIAEHVDRVEQISELAIGFAQRKGQYDQALTLARQGTERRKDDSSAWLFLAQAALLNVPHSPEQMSDLIAEADQALDEAIRLSGTGDVNIWLFKFRFASQFQGMDAVQDVVEALEKSSVPEKRRRLLSIRARLHLKEFETAKGLLDAGLAESPRDVELKVALVEYHRFTGNQQALLETLEDLVRIDPKREDFRKALAIALATNTNANATPPWDRIASLIGDSANEKSESSQLFHALLLATRGDENQLKTSKQLLRDLVKSRTPEIANEAIRLSIAIEQKRWVRSTEQIDTTVSADSSSEIRRLYDVLTKRKDPTIPDLVQYADFLLRSSKLTDVPWLIDRVQALAPESPHVLHLRIRLAKEEKQLDRVPAIVEAWVKGGNNEVKASKTSLAGQTLLELGMDELGVKYLERAYGEDPKEFRPYVVSLSRSGKLKEAIKVCVDQATSKAAPDAIAMLADIAFNDAGLNALDDGIESVFAKGLEEFPSNVVVLESLGTLRLNQQRYTEAYDLLRRAESLAPNSLMTLNNLAVATAEIPGREPEGLPRIKRAVEIYGRHPELLDTLGVVQMRCGMLVEAESSLREAMTRGKDPRFRLHLIQVLGAKKDRGEINKLVKDLKIRELRSMPLTASERRVLDEVSKLSSNESS
jgi:tetratricopeptide (TPR) repeat protein